MGMVGYCCMGVLGSGQPSRSILALELDGAYKSINEEICSDSLIQQSGISHAR